MHHTIAWVFPQYLGSSTQHQLNAHPDTTQPPSNMTQIPRSKAKTAHVNMMTDTIIANLPADALRSVIRVILTTEPSVTSILEEQTRIYLKKTANQPVDQLFQSTAEGVASTSNFTWAQQRLRCAIGCGLVLDSFPILNKIVDESVSLADKHTVPRST